MRNKISTMIAVCGLAVLACTPVSLACDKDAAAQCGAHKNVEAAQVVKAKSGCSKSDKAAKAAVLATSGKSACCPKTGKPVTVQASTGKAGCPAELVMRQLAMALMDMNENGGADSAGRAEVVKAMRIMADSKPELACDKVAKLIACESKGDSAEAITVAAGVKSQCSSKRAKSAQVQVAANKACDPANCDPSKCAKGAKAIAAGNKACDPANCDPSKCSKSAKVIAAGGKKTCGTTAQASFVAFDCKKTDRLARAVARAYLDLMRELKVSAGAEGCAATTATKVLASVLEDMQAEQTAAAPTVETDEGVAKIETVSFGAVSDESKARKTCGSSRN
jgi:hypothetical protein